MVSGISSVGTPTAYVQRANRAPSHEEMFARMDTNGDGKIDQSELEAMLQQAPVREGVGAAPAPPENRPDAAQLIERFDQDGDGALNADEAREMGEALRAQMEAMMIRHMQASQTSALLPQDSDDQDSSSPYTVAALQSYATNAASARPQSLIDTLG